MLKIRLQRIGARNQPTYRLVVTDKRTGPKSGKHVEVLGSFDPRLSEGEQLRLKPERISYWLGQGAQPSDTVHNHLVQAGLIKGAKINVLPKKRPPQPEPEVKTDASVTEESEQTSTKAKSGNAQTEVDGEPESAVKSDDSAEVTREPSVEDETTPAEASSAEIEVVETPAKAKAKTESTDEESVTADEKEKKDDK